jgi:carboxyl-terminal processing protease
MNKSNPEMPAPAYKSSQDEDKDLFDAEQLSQLLDSPEFHEATFAEAKETIRRRYERRRSIMRQREAADIQEAYINAMTQLFDPHSKFLSADTLEGFNVSVQNSFVGIGAMLQDEDGICVIKDILPGGPAEASQQLNSGDEILGVGQGKEGEFIDVVDVQLRFIVRKIKGKKGTFVRLLIRPANASDPSDRKEVTIARGEVKLTANLAAAELIQIPNDENGTTLVGVIELPSFYGNIGLGDTLTTASDDISELLKKLTDAGAQGIVLDLRNNGGGLLSEAIHVTGLFIPTGPVVLVRDKSGHTEIQLDLNPKILWDGPLIVLTSRFSASASEIVAGALQDHKRAIVIGNSSTHGKGTVQEVYNMNSRPIFSFIPQISKPAGARPVASKITIKQFYLPSGRSTQLKGVPSDIVLPSSNEFLPIGESDLPHALPWDQVQNALRGRPTLPAKITNTNDLEQIESLRQASKARQDTMQEFEFLKKQIAWRKERYEKTMVSLNLAKRIEEKIEDEAYIKEFKEAREILYESNYPTEKFLTKISEEQEAISLKNKLSIEGDDAADEEEEPNLDIYLRETARIMADWIHALEAPQGKRVAETAELLSTK